jgi:hypothetical protein
MAVLHDPSVRASIEARLSRLRPDTRPAWGKMSVDQMVWHVNQTLASALGRVAAPQDRAPLPRPVMKFIVLNMPWPKGAPTNKAFVAQQRHDFDTELVRCRDLIGELVSRPIDEPPPVHPMLGRMSGREQSRLHAKHLDHHLRQFGV